MSALVEAKLHKELRKELEKVRRDLETKGSTYKSNLDKVIVWTEMMRMFDDAERVKNAKDIN